MRTKTTNTFLKQLALLPVEVRERVEEFAFVELREADMLTDLSNVKKLKGFKESYRARFGNYRVGIEVEGDSVVLKVVMHRSRIYRKFPK
jgi:mRNA interferase RelE/StbE